MKNALSLPLESLHTLMRASVFHLPTWKWCTKGCPGYQLNLLRGKCPLEMVHVSRACWQKRGSDLWIARKEDMTVQLHLEQTAGQSSVFIACNLKLCSSANVPRSSILARQGLVASSTSQALAGCDLMNWRIFSVGKWEGRALLVTHLPHFTHRNFLSSLRGCSIGAQ